MKITFFTLANIRPDFIEPQFLSIKKFIKDADVEYIIFNNASDNRHRSRDIEKICKRLGIRTIKVRHTRDFNNDASMFVGDSMNTAWQDHLRHIKGILCYIDSDMFMIKDLHVEKMMEKGDFVFTPNFKGEGFPVLFPWTGLMFFNMDTLPNVHEMTWEPGVVLGERVDVGGYNHFYMEKYKDKIRILFLEMWNLESGEETPTGKKIAGSINGNIRFELVLDKENKLISITTKDRHISDKKSFPYQPEREDYHELIKSNLLKVWGRLRELDLDLPKPFWIDFFKVHSAPIEDAFIFHYKSGGNWLPFYTDAYNKQKTRQLYKMLHNLGVVDEKYQTVPDDILVPTYKETTSLKKIYKKIKMAVKSAAKRILRRNGAQPQLKPKVYDTFSFFNELDLLEIRLSILDPHVDFFVIAESPETFSGKPKPLYYAENKERFAKWHHKIIHHVVDDYPKDPELKALADAHADITAGLTHFHRAFYQKESIKRALLQAGAKDEDIVYYGDVDEIWKPQKVSDKTYKLRQLGYSYFLNNRSSEDWRGTVVTKYKNIKNSCLNDLRAKPTKFLDNGGWHFTNLGGAEAVISKLEAYDHQEYNTPEIKARIVEQIKNNKDFIGRALDYQGKEFKFWIDEKDLPEYLLKNKEKYKKYFKNS